MNSKGNDESDIKFKMPNTLALPVVESDFSDSDSSHESVHFWYFYS